MLVNNWKGYKLQEYMQPLEFNVIRNLEVVLFLQAGRKSVDSLKDPPRSKWTPAHVSPAKSRNLLTPLQGASPAGRHVSASPPPNAPSSKGQSLSPSQSPLALCHYCAMRCHHSDKLGLQDGTTRKRPSLDHKQACWNSLSCNLSNVWCVRYFNEGIVAWH